MACPRQRGVLFVDLLADPLNHPVEAGDNPSTDPRLLKVNLRQNIGLIGRDVLRQFADLRGDDEGERATAAKASSTLAMTAATRGMPAHFSPDATGASAKVNNSAMAIGRNTSRPKYRAATAVTIVATVGNSVRGWTLAADRMPAKPDPAFRQAIAT